MSNFGNYNATYGALGGIVILLIWFYLTGFLVLLGAEINAFLARKESPAELERQGAHVPGPDDELRHAIGQRAGPQRPGRLRVDTPEEPPLRRRRGRARPEPEPTVAQQARARPAQTFLVGLVSSVALWRATRNLISKQS